MQYGIHTLYKQTSVREYLDLWAKQRPVLTFFLSHKHGLIVALIF